MQRRPCPPLVVRRSGDPTEVEDQEPTCANRRGIPNDVVDEDVEVDAGESSIGVVEQQDITDHERPGGGSQLGGTNDAEVACRPVQPGRLPVGEAEHGRRRPGSGERVDDSTQTEGLVVGVCTQRDHGPQPDDVRRCSNLRRSGTLGGHDATWVSAIRRRMSSMSRPCTLPISSSRAEAGRAPGSMYTITLSRSTISVGMDMMSNAAANSRSASVSTVPNTRSGCVSDAFSNTGANARQGPHHDAQKSTSTISVPVTSVSKLSFVTATVAIGFSSLYPVGYRIQRPATLCHSPRAPEIRHPGHDGAGSSVQESDDTRRGMSHDERTRRDRRTPCPNALVAQGRTRSVGRVRPAP